MNETKLNVYDIGMYRMWLVCFAAMDKNTLMQFKNNMTGADDLMQDAMLKASFERSNNV